MEARHVSWCLERIAAEDRVLDPRGHALLNMRGLVLQAQPDGESPESWVARNASPEELVARGQDALRRAAGRHLLAAPARLASARDCVLRRAALLGHAAVAFADAVLPTPTAREAAPGIARRA